MEETRETMKLPAVALRELTVMPGMILHFDISRERSKLAIEQAMLGDQKVFLITRRENQSEDPTVSDLFRIGCVATIRQITKLPNKIIRVMVEGLSRAEIGAQDETQTSFLLLDVDAYPLIETPFLEEEEEARVRLLKELMAEFIVYQPKISKSIIEVANNIDSLALLLEKVTVLIPFSYRIRQSMLETQDTGCLYDLLVSSLNKELSVAKIKGELSSKIKGQVEKNQKEYLLREQMKYIRQELGDEEALPDAEQFEEDLGKLKASKEVKAKIRKEIGRFRSVSGSSSESAVERAYIETLLEMPWEKSSKDNSDILQAGKILDEDHYGLNQVKERILEFLAVRSLTKLGDSPIICLVGPPGTGKTSIAKSVAKALNKKYVRICLGGVKDEAEIRGHRKTYVGAMPGRIAAGLKQAGVKNPLMLFDEIDKLGSDYKGDPASAMLEVLDSEQNAKFCDHYIEIPIDLSEVLFIATANSAAQIPRPLLDRMEIIEVNSYTANEKFHIAKEHLWEKQLKKNGLKDNQLTITDAGLEAVISFYTREAGVRELERKIGELCRKAAKEILTTKKKAVHISESNLHRFLGKQKYRPDKINETDEIGIARGLAWTSVGGDTLQIEVNIMPGKGELDLTGQLGDVMKESAIAGLTYIRSISDHYHVENDFFQQHDIHLHIPEGAVPKDGPSAGITMATAMLSAITKIPIRADLAMTGEITLRGRVLPIGGLKEKLLAAKTAGIKTVLVPKENQKDVAEIDSEICEGMRIKYVERMDQVIKEAFVSLPKKGKTVHENKEC